MAKLVQKSGYIKSEKAGGYMKYIATREGVEKLTGNGPVTKGQRELIQKLLHDFPDAVELFEYEDYRKTPTLGTASAFITMALDANLHEINSESGYMSYIATRPRVERRGAHGLFNSAAAVDLDAAMSELEAHDGNVWTIIYSLRREDAARLGYDNAEAWRALLMMHAQDLAKAMKIPADHFRWYAAFHNEEHHPHIHMMVWSDDPKEGFLTRDGIAAMRSKLTNTIFRDEMIQIYERKDVAYKELIEAAQDTMRELIQKMEHQLCDNPVIEEQMRQLVQALETTTGKKQYGYLKKSLKALVDTIVDELARQPEVAKCSETWNQIRDELNECSGSRIPREHLPLSQQKEFRRIKNDIIREAENIRLGLPTFEDEKMQDEPEPEAAHEEQRSNSVYEQARRYRAAKTVLQDVYALDEEHTEAVRALEQLWAEGYTVAAHQLGKFYRDDLSTMRDHEKAERWFRLSAEAGNDFSEYALGKLLLSQKRTGEAVRWLDKAARHGNPFAQYRLGKLCLTGESVKKDVRKALEYLTAAARQGNPFAQYTLGKLYLLGRDVEQDREQAMASVMSTVLSRLNAFLDSELEQILCFDSAIDAEKFASEKSAIFLILPEEDTTKNFMAGLMIQNLSRELFAVADENGGKLKNRVVLFCDEFGTMPPFDILPLFSAGRSRRLTLVPIIQSLAQLEKNYGKEGCEIIQDNCQDTIFGGFAPNSQTAEVLSKALGSRTVLSGSVSRGRNDPSQSLQMMERALLTPDELKSIPKGSFIVMKTGTHPMRTRLQLFLNWGITFGEPYVVPERANRAVAYANRVDLERNLPQLSEPEEMDESRGYAVSSRGGIAHTPAQERAVKRGKQMKTFGEEER